MTGENSNKKGAELSFETVTADEAPDLVQQWIREHKSESAQKFSMRKGRHTSSSCLGKSRPADTMLRLNR